MQINFQVGEFRAKQAGVILIANLIICWLLLLIFSSVASANFGVHGGYLADTDYCGGCHRTHTALSGITWSTATGETRTALLISTATLIVDFCYTCHGAGAQGAATDVEGGIFDSSPTSPNESNLGGILNAGGFSDIGGLGKTVTSSHIINSTTGTAWGEGTSGPGTAIRLDCTSCHDPHGSSNYRSLKDYVNGHKVGGYLGDFRTNPNPDPDPWVVANEVGYPQEGFRLHTVYDGVTPNYNGQVFAQYRPDYTTGRYARAVDGPDADTSPDRDRGISGWCIACHEQYATKAGVIDIVIGPGGSKSWGAEDTSTAYNAGDQFGAVVRHRHPVNAPLSNWYVGGVEANGPIGDRALVYNQSVWQTSFTNGPAYVDLPLEHNPATESQGSAQTYTIDDYIGCLTCHRAHGTDAVMTGYANVADSSSPQPDSGAGGVPPVGDSALLRADNRGVCERCHNK
jgi:cytochrome c553